MTGLQRASILLKLLDGLKAHGSWCGETAIQKSCYLLQDLLRVPLEVRFVLYRHGPYSFDLTDELTALRADSILRVDVPDGRYGPRYLPGDRGALVRARFPKTVARYSRQTEFVAQHLGPKNVAELERLATALFIRQQVAPAASVEDRARELCNLKPHITPESALEATKDMDRISCESEQLLRIVA